MADNRFGHVVDQVEYTFGHDLATAGDDRGARRRHGEENQSQPDRDQHGQDGIGDAEVEMHPCDVKTGKFVDLCDLELLKRIGGH